MPSRNIIVIGASAGGVEALTRMCAAIPPDFPGSIFIVLHSASSGESRLPQILDRAGPLVAKHPDDATRIDPGTIYVARPNRHMIIDDGAVRVIAGPRRNGYRPSINALFESAAAVYGSRAVGVILSGSLDDGTLGLLQIKNAGGVALVQSPDEAMFRGMPTSALEHVDIDFSGSIEAIASRLDDLAREEVETMAGNMSEWNQHMKPEPDSVPEENGNLDRIAGFTCPDCGGVLQEVGTGGFVHFRCHVGHEVSEKSLLQSQGRDIETALWTALRVLEERTSLGKRVEQRAIERGNSLVLERIRSQNEEALRNAEILRHVLHGVGQDKSINALQDDLNESPGPEPSRH